MAKSCGITRPALTTGRALAVVRVVYGTPVQLPQHQLEAAADAIEAMNVNRQPCRAAAQP